MKKIFYILASAIVALGAVACENEGLDNVNPEVKGEGLTITVNIDEATKVAFEGLTPSWEANDKLTIGTYEFTYTDNNTFTCEKEGVYSLCDGQKKEITAGTFDSSKGINGSAWWAQSVIEREGTVVELQLVTALLKVTAAADNTVLKSVMFSNDGEDVTLTKDKETYVPIWQGDNTTVTYYVDGVECKSLTKNFDAGKVYTLGTLVAPSEWSIIGDKTSWGSDIGMFATDVDNVYVARNVTFDSSTKSQGDASGYNEFKIRKDIAWTESYGVGACVKVGYKVALLGRNTGVEEDGTYDIYFNSSTKQIAVMPVGQTWEDAKDPKFNDGNATCTWGIVGSMNGWDAPDVAMYWDGTYWYAKGVQFKNGDTFKCRQNTAWDWQYNANNISGTTANIASDGTGDNNFKASKDCSYDIYVSKTQHKVWFKAAGQRP